MITSLAVLPATASATPLAGVLGPVAVASVLAVLVALAVVVLRERCDLAGAV
jgi:hypothetical protein